MPDPDAVEEESTVRSKDELLKAHDALGFAIENDLLGRNSQILMGAALDVLCWVLSHEHDSTEAFASMLERLIRTHTRYQMLAHQMETSSRN